MKKYTSQKDIRGNELARCISRLLGIKDGDSMALVEMREGEENGEGLHSFVAHGQAMFVELVVYDGGKTSLKETFTRGEGAQLTVTVWPNGKVELAEQEFSSTKGLIGEVYKATLDSSPTHQTRLKDMARQVLPLARQIDV